MSCNKCPYLRTWQEDRGEHFGAPCSETMSECRVIEGATNHDLTDEQLDRVYKCSDEDTADDCPVFKGELNG